MKLSHYLPWLVLMLIPGVCGAQGSDVDYDYTVEEEFSDDDAANNQDELGHDVSDTSNDGSLTSSSTQEPSYAAGAERKPRHIIKRSIWNRTKNNWPHDIPFVITDSYKGNVDRFKRVLRYISSRLCVRFHDTTNTRDPKDPTWFTSNGFKTNSYVSVGGGSGCASVLGQGEKAGRRGISPCDSFRGNLHEMFHMLGGIHTQKAIERNSHIAVHFENVNRAGKRTYRVAGPQDVVTYSFDPGSVMLYGTWDFNCNGLETYTFIRDDARYSKHPRSNENVIFLELNKVYRCNKVFCNNSQTDCSPGYHTLVNGACRCVCPDDLDPATNCKELINQPTSNITWPKTPVVLFGANGCPDEFIQKFRMLPIAGFSQPKQDPVPFPIPSNNFTLQLPICVKRASSTDPDVDWLSWPPGGNYCILQQRRVPCAGAFKDGSLQITTAEALRPVGAIGATDVLGTNVTMKFCCQNQDPSYMVVDLPNGHAFKWIAYGSCPNVRGMAVTQGKVTIATKQMTASGSLPPLHVYTSDQLELQLCVYNPPVYGCNQVITLDSNTRSVRVTTPGFGTAREPNRRCFYAFKNPKNARLRLTFNKYDLHNNDKFLVKKYNQWLDPDRIKNDNFPHQIVSVRDYLALEYWSSWEATTHSGVDFTVDLLLGEELCYDLLRRGQDYLGDKSVSETYEECLPWEKATTCDEFPFHEPSLLASGNKCRNPAGELDEPWCYTYINGSDCHKRYCDVCNIKTPVDRLDNCRAFIDADPSFCNSTIHRFGCFKTCGLPLQDYVPAKCGRPKFPSDGIPINTNALTNYKQGDKITVKCKLSESLTSQITCTKNGWTELTSACIAENCRDELSTSTCEEILMAFPNFCLDSRFSEASGNFCASSCGRCPGDKKCSETNNKNYRRTSSKSVIQPGDVMSFACDPGLYHVGGNLQMACSVSGRLLGTPQICSLKPSVRDIKLETVRKRSTSLTGGRTLLLDHADYRIPFNGKITKWFYYCTKTTPLTFLVYRKIGQNYTFIGANQITCVPDFKMEYGVPADNQISVNTGDVYGVYAETSDSLSVSICNYSTDKILQIPSVKGVFFSQLAKSNRTFPDLYCAVPSLGIRVEP
ncbi:hypothetical protein BsWGS_25452 [Bradybaena similaris]